MNYFQTLAPDDMPTFVRVLLNSDLTSEQRDRAAVTLFIPAKPRSAGKRELRKDYLDKLAALLRERIQRVDPAKLNGLKGTDRLEAAAKADKELAAYRRFAGMALGQLSGSGLKEFKAAFLDAKSQAKTDILEVLNSTDLRESAFQELVDCALETATILVAVNERTLLNESSIELKAYFDKRDPFVGIGLRDQLLKNVLRRNAVGASDLPDAKKTELQASLLRAFFWLRTIVDA